MFECKIEYTDKEFIESFSEVAEAFEEKFEKKYPGRYIQADTDLWDRYTIPVKLSKIWRKHARLVKYENEAFTAKCDDFGYELIKLEFKSNKYKVTKL